MPIGEPVEEIAVVEDLIEWTIFGEQTNMYVFNWKTGRLIWSFDFQVHSVSIFLIANEPTNNPMGDC